jgi:hypothetical protein
MWLYRVMLKTRFLLALFILSLAEGLVGMTLK